LCFHAFERASKQAREGEREREKRKSDRARTKEKKKKKAREKLFPPFPPGICWSQNPSIKIDDVVSEVTAAPSDVL